MSTAEVDEEGGHVDDTICSFIFVLEGYLTMDAH